MANNMNGFLLNDEGPEQNYTIQEIGLLEQQRLLLIAIEDGVELVAIYEAESSCIGIMPRRVAEILVAHLNSQKHDPLESLGYEGDVLCQEMIDIRKEQDDG